MPDLFIYTTPAEASVRLTLDSGAVLDGEPCVANGRQDAHRLAVPPDTPAQGGLLRVSCAGKTPFEGRGIVRGTEFVFDDVHLADAAVEPEPPPVFPYPTGTPEEIIVQVYDQGDHDLETKQGCGEFVEDCCDALHASDPMWGHIKKTGAQNQWNGHAVDALMLAAGEACGIYDIIHDSESPNATPSYTYKGAPDLSLWYYNEPS